MTSSSTAWRDISSAPKDGTEVWLNHSRSAPGYACKGCWTGEGWAMPNFFISPDMRMFRQPDQWAPIGGEA